MKNIVLFSLLLLTLNVSYAQELDLGAQFGLSRTSMRFTSDYTILTEQETKPILGANLGGSLRIKYESISFRNFLGLQFTSYRNMPEVIFTDENGNNLGSFNKTIVNLFVQLSSIPTYDFNNGFYVGAGPSLSVLLTSRFPNIGISNSTPFKTRWLKNYQYRRIAFAVPILLGYDWQRSSLFLSYSFGVSNRNHKEAFIKQRENNLLVGYNFLIGKKKD